MEQDKNTFDAAQAHDDGSYVVKKSKKSSIVAFIVCVLVACVIWAYAEANDKETSSVSDTASACAEIDSEIGEM